MPSGARMARRGSVASSRVSKALFTDDFNRANGALGSPDWSVISANLTVDSNQLQGGGGKALRSADCFTDDMFSQVTIGSSTGGTFTLYVRTGSTSWPTIVVNVTPSSGNWAIVTDPTSSGGDHTTRASGSAGSGVVVAGVVVRLEALGNVYSLKVNGSSVGSWTDSGGAVTPGPSRRRTGVSIGSGASVRLDDWVSGDL